MNFSLIEKFDKHDKHDKHDCGINFVQEDITTIECPQYSNDSYRKLREDYYNALNTKFLEESEEKKKCISNLLEQNIKTSKFELETIKSMEFNHTNYYDSLFPNINLDELQNNVLLTEQRIKETDELLYINNIKYYGIIVSLIIILIIELILIKL